MPEPSDLQAAENLSPHWDLPTSHPVYLRLYFQFLLSQGVDVAPLLIAGGLGSWDEMMRRQEPVSYRVVHRLIQEILALNLNPDLPLQFGAAVPVSAHGPLGYAVVSSRDLRQALQTLERYTTLRNANFTYRFSESGDEFQLELIDLLGRNQYPRERDFFYALMLTLILRMIEAVCGPHLDRLHVEVPFAKPVWHAEILRLFPGTIRYSCTCLRFGGDVSILELPCATANTAAYDLACQECHRLMDQSRNSSLSSKLMSLLVARNGAYPSLDAAADYLHMSSRTLGRKLLAEGTTYKALLDTARQQKALWYLENTCLKVEDIAERLGYNNASSFSRVCKRWFDSFPSEVRSRANGR